MAVPAQASMEPPRRSRPRDGTSPDDTIELDRAELEALLDALHAAAGEDFERKLTVSRDGGNP